MLSDAHLISFTDAEHQAGIDHRVVSRWRNGLADGARAGVDLDRKEHAMSGGNGNGEHEAPKPSAEVDRLAGVAAGSNIVRAVHALPGGAFIPTIQKLTADYWAQADDDDDSGLTAFLQARWPEAQRAWTDDVATVTGDAPELTYVRPVDAKAILAAAEAWRCDGAGLAQRHYDVLVQAVMARRGPFVRFLRDAEGDPNAHMARHRDQARELFVKDLERVIKEAGG